MALIRCCVFSAAISFVAMTRPIQAEPIGHLEIPHSMRGGVVIP